MNDYVKDFMEENKISKDLEGVLRTFFNFIYDGIFEDGYYEGYKNCCNDFEEEEGEKNA